MSPFETLAAMLYADRSLSLTINFYLSISFATFAI